MSFANKVTASPYNFVFLIVKIILLESQLSLSFSLPSSDKTQYFFHLSFNSTLQLINCISSDLQKLLMYFNGTAIAASFRMPLSLLEKAVTQPAPNNNNEILKNAAIENATIKYLSNFWR